MYLFAPFVEFHIFYVFLEYINSCRRVHTDVNKYFMIELFSSVFLSLNAVLSYNF